jgi:gamma-glutamylcysteine synthetase
MNREGVKDLLYKRFVEPTQSKKTLYAGVEFEFPILNLSKAAVDFVEVHTLTSRLKEHFSFEVAGLDEEGAVSALLSPLHDDMLTYDCSYNNLELSFGKTTNLNDVRERFVAYYRYIQSVLQESRHTLTGMGINPYRRYNRMNPLPNGRYRMLYHHLLSYRNFENSMVFHQHPEFGMFSSASQVQLDVLHGALIPTVRAFNRLEPFKAALFSNSVLLGERDDLACCRDLLWENSMQGYNPHNIGIHDALPESVDELLEYLSTTSIYCVERGSKYINFLPIPITEYFQTDSVAGEYFEDGGYHTVTFAPAVEDLRYLRTFKFVDLTFRGTIEYRSVCCQPVPDVMTSSAFHLGLVAKIAELNELLDNDTVLYHHGFTAGELRKLMNRRVWPDFVDRGMLRNALLRILALSETGLKERGQGEERLLTPLFERAERLENPGQYFARQLALGQDMERLIREYAALTRE